MIKLFIIADDFTGALDTGVQLAAQGAKTRVITDPEADFSKIGSEVSVLVLDAETRHLCAQDAYDIVFRAVRQAVDCGIPYIYKKTDSALRGNIGAELRAVLCASGYEQLPFLPAFPQMGRTTLGGIHYISGTPVAESVFGLDPFEPVRHSSVASLISEQCEIPVTSCPAITEFSTLSDTNGVVVYDAQTEEDLAIAGKRLFEAGRLHVMAGCAGFGAMLPDLLSLNTHKTCLPKLDDHLLVLCGSVNPITVQQVAHAEKNGFAHIRMTPAQKLSPGYFSTEEGLALITIWEKILAQNTCCIIDGNDEEDNTPTADYAKAHGMTIDDVRVNISGALGQIMMQLFESPSVGTLLITGGDTLLQCMNSVGVHEMEPIGELFAGVVLSRFTLGGRTRFVISKSGGFGSKTLLTDLARMIQISEEKDA